MNLTHKFLYHRRKEVCNKEKSFVSIDDKGSILEKYILIVVKKYKMVVRIGCR